MKIRTGFVSNSSSSSFVIDRDNLTDNQVDLIIHHSSIDPYFIRGDNSADEDIWEIDASTSKVTGYTSMDNFDMQKFLNEIGVAENNIKWEFNG